MPNSLDRRQFFETTTLVAATAVAAALPSTARADAPATAPAYDVKPMPFNANAVKGLSSKLLTSHYENNYTGAAKRAERDRRPACKPRLGDGAGLRRQRPQARTADRDEFDDPARTLFQRSRR
jgi:hypothetical protein